MGLLQTYYTKAVRTYNKSPEEMRNGIMAGLLHSMSTNEEPHHENCPTGEHSWCFFQRAVARGNTPPSHKGRCNTFINQKVAAYITPIYDRLTKDDLMKKCMSGMTQNHNESFHSLLWSKCPKTVFHSRTRVEVATSLAVGEWNVGSLGTQLLMTNISLQVSPLTVASGQKRDLDRKKRSAAAVLEKAKKRRAAQRQGHLREQTRLREEEKRVHGGPLYGAGSASI